LFRGKEIEKTGAGFLCGIEFIDRIGAHGGSSLSEAESKSLLSRYGVPVVEEMIAYDEHEAETLSESIGFPVVLKGLGKNITHKTERGLVIVNLKSPEEIRNSFRVIKEAAGRDWEGCLIQPFVRGRREFAAGLIRDPQFGPVVMFGLGGILTEAIGDVVFRIAPLKESDSRDMIGELASRKLLGGFRGEAAAEIDQLVRVLTGLSRLGLERPGIKEVDVNPLIVGPDGRVTAVDALVVLDGGEGKQDDEKNTGETTEEINAAIDIMTHPKAIAVMGATRTPGDGFPGMYGCIRNFGYPGRLYPINPKAQEIDGVKAYPDLVSLPEKVDLVVISVPAPSVPDALRDCIASGNKNIHIFTSGFKETGEEAGLRLHAEIERIAREGGLRVVGPNCMGFYVPASRMLTWTAAPVESGPVSFISQSGGNAQDFTSYASSRLGIHFSKVISYGNALTLDSTDFLEYLAVDDETRIVAMYIEGVRNGRRLFDLVSEINLKKPVILMKGGLTESGARAAASHTGSMAGAEKIWRAFFRQTGAVRVDSLEEMAEAAKAFMHFNTCGGRRAVILGTGGGVGVAAADACAQAGLELPVLPPDLLTQLRGFIPPAGNMITNPIDAHLIFLDHMVFAHTLDILSSKPNLDMFIVSLHLDWLRSRQQGALIEKIGRFIADEARAHTNGKPLVVVVRQYQPNPATKECRSGLEDILLKSGVPAYDSLQKAVSALAKLAEYHEFIAARKPPPGLRG
jgi:acyl-CoA synthetase (NDP forming)